jgi:hypothetical protein
MMVWERESACEGGERKRESEGKRKKEGKAREKKKEREREKKEAKMCTRKGRKEYMYTCTLPKP